MKKFSRILAQFLLVIAFPVISENMSVYAVSQCDTTGACTGDITRDSSGKMEYVTVPDNSSARNAEVGTNAGAGGNEHIEAANRGDFNAAVNGWSTSTTTWGAWAATAGWVGAATAGEAAAGDKASTAWGGNSSGWPTTVTVTEEIPGMKCIPAGGSNPTDKKFKCTIQPGFGSVMLILKGLIKYATFITALIGVLMLVVSGVQYSISGADKWAADAAKKRIEKVLAGIVLLFLIGFVLNSVAPWVYR